MEMRACQNPLLLIHTSEITTVHVLRGESYVAFRIAVGFSKLRGNAELIR